ncbi:hypothetical protein CHS0354_003261 [Potamilus streckersoni]|uniref:von Willebrand factor A domain-containing protein 5A n=1 Tax=Potamilus streckersoni TaxID=2493646 RepID=A0AAE0SW99_9BIVA|nr:hypothetical protein CHS0354_003261 [Potamilus streckersoni]
MSGIKEGLLSSSGFPVPLKTIEVYVTINGFVADVNSTSLYVNNEEFPIKAIFMFPLDDQSAVYNFEADIDGRHLTAECYEKERVKELYKDAVSSGYSAILLQRDENAGDIFRCSFGNLPSKAEAKICMGFATELDLEADGKVNFTLPSILNPRYSPEVAGCATPGAIPYKLIFHLKVRSPQKIKGILGLNDKLNVDYSEDQRIAMVTLAEDFKIDHDLCILVEYEAYNVPQLMLEKGDPNSENMMQQDILMVNFFLDPPATVQRTYPGEFIFVVDRSGSMQGEKIQSAKETLLLFLKSLPVDCYFNIIGFGSHFESLSREESLKYNEENLKKAEEFQREMDADMGGTDILKPLEYVFKQTLIDNYPRQLFVLTDGEVHNTGDVIKLVRSNSWNTRVFAVGIGENVSTALIRGLSKAGQGKEAFVKDSKRLQSSDPSCVCSMTLKGKLISKPFEYKKTFNLHGNTETGTSAPIHRLAAKAKLKEMQLYDEAKDLIVKVSMSTNVISKHTAFVMVNTEGRVVEGMSMEQVVPAPSIVPTLGMFCSSPSKGISPAMLQSARSLSPPLKSMSKGVASSSNLTKIRESSESDVKIDIEEKSDYQRMMDIIRLQSFQGAWCITRELLDLLCTDTINASIVNPLQGDVVATIAVISWLRKHQSERLDEWHMLVAKAIDWLVGQDIKGQSVEDLIACITL